MTDTHVLEVEKRYYTRMMDVYRRHRIYIPCLPTLIRTALRLKIGMDRRKIGTFSRAHSGEIAEWFNTRPVFFGFGLFRSGTTFLANFLNRVVPGAVIEHEANVDDYWYYHLALHSEAEAEKYIREFRLAEIVFRMRHRPGNLYGEINPFLRRHCRALQNHLPQARFFHVVRDGRSVVRSIMSREILDKTDPLGHLTRPSPEDSYAGRWNEMSRFERICWLWQEDNKYLRESIGKTLAFEKLVTDWSYFKKEFADHIGVNVSQEVWQTYTRRVGNPTQIFRMDPWSSWSDTDREKFRAICGMEMQACGYDLE
jgi:hypothetical protein